MVAWLERQPGSLDVDVWKVKKVNYTFVDLKAWLEHGGVLELEDEDDNASINSCHICNVSK